MYAYHAELYCDACGEQLERELQAAGIADSGDSDQYPQLALEGESDSPNHCASGAECLEAIDLSAYGLEPGAELHGAETRSIGALIDEQLTDHGREYLAELLHEQTPTPYQRALHRLWRDHFADALELEASKPITARQAALIARAEQRPNGAWRLEAGALGCDLVELFAAGYAYRVHDEHGASSEQLTPSGELARERIRENYCGPWN